MTKRPLFLISAQNAIKGVLINNGVLIQSQLRVGDSASEQDLHVKLDVLVGIQHLLARPGPKAPSP